MNGKKIDDLKWNRQKSLYFRYWCRHSKKGKIEIKIWKNLNETQGTHNEYGFNIVRTVYLDLLHVSVDGFSLNEMTDTAERESCTEFCSTNSFSFAWLASSHIYIYIHRIGLSVYDSYICMRKKTHTNTIINPDEFRSFSWTVGACANEQTLKSTTTLQV